MKVIIDISDNEYNTILENAEYYKKQNWGSADVWDAIKNGVPITDEDLMNSSELEDLRKFAEFVRSEVLDDYFEESSGTFAEIACRKLTKLGYVELDSNVYKKKGNKE